MNRPVARRAGILAGKEQSACGGAAAHELGGNARRIRAAFLPVPASFSAGACLLSVLVRLLVMEQLLLAKRSWIDPLEPCSASKTSSTLRF
jgi:hypothetical protein